MLQQLISAEEIEARTREIAAEIRRDFGDEELVLIAVLKGSFIFVADLCRHLGGDVKVDFVQTSSYGAEKSSSGVVQIRKDLDTNIEGKNVVVVEDIIDTGLTLSHLLQVWQTRKPKAIKVATLLSKPAARTHPMNVDYIGFEIPKKFVVGYGLDHGDRYRNLPFVAELVDEASA
ncbi:MAG: hypoxanthine phosphoribosyltransferase [Fimbriimonadaceae bacterium]|nr:hypoxanthine phosphoribosyltransferase [Fimbriimonadaceae bacterium]